MPNKQKCAAIQFDPRWCRTGTREIGLFATPSILFFELGHDLAAKEPDRDDADLIEEGQGDGHHQLVDHIRGGGEDGGDDEGEQEGVLTVLVEEGRSDQTDLGQEDHEDWQFEDHPEGDQKPQGQGEVLGDRRQDREMRGAVAGQEGEGGGEDHQIAEGGPAQETEAGEQGKGDDDLFFMLVQPRRHETPDLQEDDRRGQQDAAGHGQL